MAGCDTLDFEILCGISCELEDFGSQVLEDSCDVDGGCSNESVKFGVVLTVLFIESYLWHQRASYFGCCSSRNA